MNLNHTKERIVQIAVQLITRRGIRAFRIEEMVRILGMSKRTVYRFFPARTDLLRTCIHQIDETTRMKISFCTAVYKGNPLLNACHFLEEFVVGLYESECVFWKDLRQSPEFCTSFRNIRQEWLSGGEKVFGNCKRRGYICADTDIPLFNEKLLKGLFESRLDGEPYEQQTSFYRIMLRGIATDAGRKFLEKW